MKFLVDAQLPGRMAGWLIAHGHEALHTRDLPEGNRTSDAAINYLSVRERRVLVTKDEDSWSRPGNHADWLQEVVKKNAPRRLDGADVTAPGPARDPHGVAEHGAAAHVENLDDEMHEVGRAPVALSAFPQVRPQRRTRTSLPARCRWKNALQWRGRARRRRGVGAARRRPARRVVSRLAEPLGPRIGRGPGRRLSGRGSRAAYSSATTAARSSITCTAAMTVAPARITGSV